MSRSISICAACCAAADAGQYGEEAHVKAGCEGKGRCACQHRTTRTYAPGYPKTPAASAEQVPANEPAAQTASA